MPCFFSVEARSETTTPTPAAPPSQGLLGFMDRLPEFVDTNLPFFAPRGAYWFYARPSIGNPFQGKYFRLDAGMWVKVTKSIDFNIGAQSYVWRDSNEGDATRYGFYGATTGIKYNRSLAGPIGTAMSVGLNFSTPIGRPPLSLSDGFRHTDPFFTYTRPLSARLHLVGFASVGADMLAHTSLPDGYGKNALHSNSLNGAVGATREFKYFAVSASLNGATTALMSKHALQVFSINPKIVVPAENIFPALCAKLPHWHINLSLSAHATTGPDGQQYGVSSSVSVNFTSRK
ncbi:MAG TPA: hypothetical protein VNW30_07940 [Opitutaceae bacterium]|nr:hypothetical protein [Opitutaceae bacterium]